LVEDEKAEAICQLPMSKEIKLNKTNPLTDSIAEIQEHIREEIGSDNKVVLLAKGFLGTLVSIAQTNMLPYYRQDIRGLILEDVPVNLYQSCLKKPLKLEDENCHYINNLHSSIGALASKTEIFKAISPMLQMDWYWPKVILLGERYQEGWLEAFADNVVKYKKVNGIDIEEALNYFALIQTHKVQPKQVREEPEFFGPLLRFHLNKVLYQEKNQVLMKENIPYGVDEEQVYDVYFRDKSQDNPIIIYVHGGGWTKGDKSAYDGFSMQYADRGYTVVNINYRLMEHPKIGMDEMIRDVKLAIEHTLDNAQAYQGNSKEVFVFAESAGGQLASIALSKMDENHTISGAFFNSISTDLRLFSQEKQLRLSNIKEKKERLEWLDNFSPINQLHNYPIPTLIAHSFSDYVVPAQHLEDFEMLSILHHNNIQSIWVEGGTHPIAPKHRSLQPSYIDIENKLLDFLTESITFY
jgi:acetyl esterase/lipase